MDDQTFQKLQTELQAAVDSEGYAVAIFRCNGDKVTQFLTCHNFPHAKAGNAARMLLTKLLPEDRS